MGGFFLELSLILVVAFAISYLMKLLKQPLLIGYILTGLLVGPLFFNILATPQNYESFSHIGIAFLLFIVGMHLNIKLIKEVGWVSLITGLGQIISTSALGTVILMWMGYGLLPSVIISIGIAFSSTIIVVKLLSDKHGLDKLYGKISLGFLLVQDIVAVLALMVISSSTAKSSIPQTMFFGIMAILLTYLVAKYVVPKWIGGIAKNQELFFIFILAWCFGIASIFLVSGFSLEIGALLAGVALASSPYHHEISGRIKPLRDFFIIMFFIFLGYEMFPAISGTFLERLPIFWNMLSGTILNSIILSAFVLIINPLSVFLLIVLMGYSARTGFLSSITISQVSEFSLILVILGKTAGILTSEELTLVTMIALITITISTYFVKYGEKIYSHMKWLTIFERKDLKDKFDHITQKYPKIVIFGLDRIGYSILKVLKKQKKVFTVVDHNPKVIKRLREEGVFCIYGDASNIDFLQDLPFEKTELVISTIPDTDINESILKEIKKKTPKAVVLLTADQIDDALNLYEGGADYLVLPHVLGGHYLSTLVASLVKNPNNLIKERKRHLKELKERKQLGH